MDSGWSPINDEDSRGIEKAKLGPSNNVIVTNTNSYLGNFYV